jgi:hypothetical protein
VLLEAADPVADDALGDAELGGDTAERAPAVGLQDRDDAPVEAIEPRRPAGLAVLADSAIVAALFG